MNTNELADEIQQISNRTVNLSDKVVIAHAGLKLRQQQAEIAELKAMLGHYEDVYEGVVTHPGELTDEEILISAQYNGIRASEILDEYVIDFAKAILRKAQEK